MPDKRRRSGRVVASVHWIVFATIALLGAGALAKATAATSGGVLSVRASPVKAPFTGAEPVVLAIQVRNDGPKSCQITKRPMGAVSIVSLTRDGMPVLPEPIHVQTLDGLSGEHRNGFQRIAPGASGEVPLRALPFGDGSTFLPSVKWGPDGVPIAIAWPLREAGNYVATVGYEVPKTVVAPVDACASIAQPA